MKPEGINDHTALVTWLRDRSRGDSIIIAQRCAARVFPIWFGSLNEFWARATKSTALPFLRRLLTSGISASLPNLLPWPATPADAFSTSSSPDFNASATAAIVAANFAVSSALATSIVIVASNAADVAAQAAAASADADAIWSAIRDDAQALTNGEDLLALPLWSGNLPDWFRMADGEGRMIWAAEPMSWAFWTRWWDGVLSGQQLDWDLQRDVALIPNEDWARGPAHMAEVIAGIEARHLHPEPREVEIAGPLIHTTHTDYTFDSFRQLMKMVPFEKDISRLRDPELLKRLLRDSTDFEVVLNTLVDAATASDRQSAKALKVHADQIKAELSRIEKFGELRVGILIDLGETLQDFSGDEDVRLGLGPALPKTLSRVVDRLLGLLRTYFSPAMARMQPLREIGLSKDEDPRALIKQVMANLAQVKANDGSKIPVLAPDDLTALERIVDEVKRAGRNYETATHPEVKAELGDIFAQKAVQATFDKALYVYRGIQTLQTLVGGKDNNVADAVMRRVMLMHTASEIVAWLPHLLALI